MPFERIGSAPSEAMTPPCSPNGNRGIPDEQRQPSKGVCVARIDSLRTEENGGRAMSIPNLNGKHVLVTGGAAGIGLETALACPRDGPT